MFTASISVTLPNLDDLVNYIVSRETNLALPFMLDGGSGWYYIEVHSRVIQQAILLYARIRRGHGPHCRRRESKGRRRQDNHRHQSGYVSGRCWSKSPSCGRRSARQPDERRRVEIAPGRGGYGLRGAAHRECATVRVRVVNA